MEVLVGDDNGEYDYDDEDDDDDDDDDDINYTNTIQWMNFKKKDN